MNKHIIEMSNGYSEEKNSDFVLTDESLRRYFGSIICMGVDERPTVLEHFKQSFEEFGFWPSPISQVWKKHEFDSVHSNLHFCNNANYIPPGEDGYNLLFKIQPLFDLIVPRFATYYQAGIALSADQSVNEFRGRFGYIQFLPCKRH